MFGSCTTIHHNPYNRHAQYCVPNKYKTSLAECSEGKMIRTRATQRLFYVSYCLRATPLSEVGNEVLLKEKIVEADLARHPIQMRGIYKHR